MNVKNESRAMRTLRRIGMDRLAWSLRRLYCPVSADDFVLEVGSGGNPYARADVLVDAYENTRERHWEPLKADRPTVIGFVEALPFRENAFDFVIASHVLEHSAKPEQFLAELQRVARAGYIEVPDAFFERVNPYRDHRLEVTEREGRLIIRKKPAPVVDRELVELYEERAKMHVTRELFPRHPFDFHVRYYWKKTINYHIVNPDTDAGWPAAEPSSMAYPNPSPRQRAQRMLLDIFRLIHGWMRRRRPIDLLSLLRCPACHGETFDAVNDAIRCDGCRLLYPVRNGIPVMQVSAAVRETGS